MSDPMTCEATPNVISSPALESGLSPCAWQAGKTLDLFGPDHVLANLSAWPRLHGIEKDSTTTDTSGPSGSISSASADLCKSLANKLEAKTALRGSTLFSTTSGVKITPAGRHILALQTLALTTSASGFTSFPTPCARDGRDISRSNAFLSQRERHSPSLATRLLESGLPWQVITSIYCLAMNLPLQWNVCAPMDTVTQLMRKRQQRS